MQRVYNIYGTFTAEVLVEFTAETNITKAGLENPSGGVRKHSEETRKKISKALTGKPQSEEVVARRSVALKAAWAKRKLSNSKVPV